MPVKKSPREGVVRCLNCFERFAPPKGAGVYTCPKCKVEWRISWAGQVAKIRGPVWDKLYRKSAEQT
jgi:hypothetical protein